MAPSPTPEVSPSRCAQGQLGTDPRQRLIAAMVEAASRYGYGGATVARVIQLAGLSRATFYEHFACRDDCFLAAYRLALDEVRVAVGVAAEASASADCPTAVLDVLVAELAADPAVARLVLIEALAAPAAIRAEHERLIGTVELLVARFLDEQDPVAAIQIPAMALLAGIGEVLSMRALPGVAADLDGLRAELSKWIDAYRLPPGALPLPQRRWRELGRFARTVGPCAADKPTLLPRGRSALPPAHAATVRRQRLLDATARLAAAEGYSALTVAGIATEARVPRAAFYSHFESKQEALFAAQTHALQDGMAAAAAAYSPVGPWPQRVWKAGEALLSNVAGNADYACLDFVESYAAGPEAIRRRHENHMAFAIFFDDGYRQVPGAAVLSRVCSEAIAGGVFGLVRTLVVAERTEQMLSALPAAAYTILAPFIGPAEAASRVQALARGAG